MMKVVLVSGGEGTSGEWRDEQTWVNSFYFGVA